MNIQWPMPAHWEDFEDMCFRLAIADRAIISGRKYGRRGQEQNGVDIIGRVDNASWSNVGIQCKLKTEHLGGELRAADLREVYEKSKGLKPQLDRLYVATTIARDTEIALLVDQINESWQRRHMLEVWCWEDICDLLNAHPGVAARYYPQLADKDLLQGAGPIETFIPAGAEKMTSKRLRVLFEHGVFRSQFRETHQAVSNAVTEYVQNCLHVRKGEARRVAITLDGSELLIEDDGKTFNPLDEGFAVGPDQVGLRTIRGLKVSGLGLEVEYIPREEDFAKAFNRFAIRVLSSEGIASSSCSVHVDAAELFSRQDGFAYFEEMRIPPECDPFTIHIGTVSHASSSGTHEVLSRLKEYLGDRKLKVIVAPHRPDLYAALEPSVARWSNVSLFML